MREEPHQIRLLCCFQQSLLFAAWQLTGFQFPIFSHVSRDGTSALVLVLCSSDPQASHHPFPFEAKEAFQTSRVCCQNVTELYALSIPCFACLPLPELHLETEPCTEKRFFVVGSAHSQGRHAPLALRCLRDVCSGLLAVVAVCALRVFWTSV